MIFSETPIEGAFTVRPQPVEDDRGFFARTFCVQEFSEHGLDPTVVQRSVSYNRCRGTLRGMHLQVAPHEENKLVSCLRGSIYDVIVDLRTGSRSHGRWFGTTLTADSMEALFIPKGCAHGFITLVDDVMVHYEISGFYHPESARGLRYDDPRFGIKWPIAPSVINARDLDYPLYGSQ
jgi:dTDP-4-dehydrorhamnose 3,5-epimerase